MMKLFTKSSGDHDVIIL